MSPFDTAKETGLCILEDDHTEFWFLGAEIHKRYAYASLPELQANQVNRLGTPGRAFDSIT